MSEETSGESPPNMMQDIVDFHEKFGLAYEGPPRVLPQSLFEFRQDFKHEELEEYSHEQHQAAVHISKDGTTNVPETVAMHLDAQLDALVDLSYVVLGTAYLQFGSKAFWEAWRRVHSANMAKVRTERASDSKRGSTFDVIKPEGWSPPSHLDLVTNHAHRK